MADLFPLIGIAIPQTPPYALDGRLTRDTEGRSHDLALRRLHRQGRRQRPVRHGQRRPPAGRDRTCAPTWSRKRLDFDDLAGFIGAAPQAGGRRKRPIRRSPRRRRASSATRPGAAGHALRTRQAACDGCRRPLEGAPHQRAEAAAGRHGRAPAAGRRPAAAGAARTSASPAATSAPNIRMDARENADPHPRRHRRARTQPRQAACRT